MDFQNSWTKFRSFYKFYRVTNLFHCEIIIAVFPCFAGNFSIKWNVHSDMPLNIDCSSNIQRLHFLTYQNIYWVLQNSFRNVICWWKVWYFSISSFNFCNDFRFWDSFWNCRLFSIPRHSLAFNSTNVKRQPIAQSMLSTLRSTSLSTFFRIY